MAMEKDAKVSVASTMRLALRLLSGSASEIVEKVLHLVHYNTASVSKTLIFVTCSVLQVKMMEKISQSLAGLTLYQSSHLLW